MNWKHEDSKIKNNIRIRTSDWYEVEVQSQRFKLGQSYFELHGK